ncbi:MAG: glycoside hydrolase family 57 protein [Ignisphaera sp.]
MKDIVMFFEVHQPYRLDRRMHEKLIKKAIKGSLDPRDIEDALFDQDLNRLVIERAARKCYIPATSIIAETIRRFMGSDRKFMVSFGISGAFIEQALRWVPKVVDLFVDLVATGLVELVAQTYYHSLAFLIPPHYKELEDQIKSHLKILEDIFGVKPVSVENTEFIYNNDLACKLYSMGFKVILTEGVEWILGWRSPNFVYRGYLCDIRVLTRNYRLSDDIGFRFSNNKWDQYPLTADKYALWLAVTPGDVVVLAMDYETFGEHHWPESGIHEFLRYLPQEVLKHSHLRFSTPSRAAFAHDTVDVYDVPPWVTISWADERDLSAWLGNYIQKNSFSMLLELKRYIDAIDDPYLTRIWRLLTISDHFYYMATKFGSMEEVHQYFSPYKNAVDAYVLYAQAISILFYIIAEKARENPSKMLKNLVLPPEKAFYFKCFDLESLNISAASVKEFLWISRSLPSECIVYHLNRGDIQKWFREIYMVDDIANALDEIARSDASADEKKNLMIKVIENFLGERR